LYIGIIAKFVQIGDKYGLGSEVDVAGGPGAHMPRRPARQVALPCHRSMGAAPKAFPYVDLKSVCTDGHVGEAMDPPAHHHRLGRLQPTYKPPSCPNFDM